MEKNRTDTRTITCSSCGASFSYRVTDSMICCPYCGTSTRNEEFVEMEERQEQRTVKKRISLVFVIVAAVVALSFLLTALVSAYMHNRVMDAIENNGGRVNINVAVNPETMPDWVPDDDDDDDDW